MSDLATYHWFWKEAINRLESLRNRIKEGRDLDEAANFCRWLLFCRIDKILEPHNNNGFLKVDSALLMWKAKDLLTMVQDMWASGAVTAKEQTHLEAIHHKLDLIAGVLASGSPGLLRSNGEGGFAAYPALSVLPGVEGANENLKTGAPEASADGAPPILDTIIQSPKVLDGKGVNK